MKRTKSRLSIYIVLVAVALGLLGMMTEGCNGAKKCGCGHDLNGVYKTRRHRWG